MQRSAAAPSGKFIAVEFTVTNGGGGGGGGRHARLPPENGFRIILYDCGAIRKRRPGREEIRGSRVWNFERNGTRVSAKFAARKNDEKVRV